MRAVDMQLDKTPAWGESQQNDPKLKHAWRWIQTEEFAGKNTWWCQRAKSIRDCARNSDSLLPCAPGMCFLPDTQSPTITQILDMAFWVGYSSLHHRMAPLYLDTPLQYQILIQSFMSSLSLRPQIARL